VGEVTCYHDAVSHTRFGEQPKYFPKKTRAMALEAVLPSGHEVGQAMAEGFRQIDPRL